jgi:hypothetical protein
MNVEIGTETPIFLFFEYLFRNFGILSLQCVEGNATFLVTVCLCYYPRSLRGDRSNFVYIVKKNIQQTNVFVTLHDEKDIDI